MGVVGKQTTCSAARSASFLFDTDINKDNDLTLKRSVAIFTSYRSFDTLISLYEFVLSISSDVNRDLFPIFVLQCCKFEAVQRLA